MEGKGRHHPWRLQGWGRCQDMGCYEKGFAPVLQANVSSKYAMINAFVYRKPLS
jgi:hypothetical protein